MYNYYQNKFWLSYDLVNLVNYVWLYADWGTEINPPSFVITDEDFSNIGFSQSNVVSTTDYDDFVNVSL